MRKSGPSREDADELSARVAAKRRYLPSAFVTPFENHSSPAIWPLDYNPLVLLLL